MVCTSALWRDGKRVWSVTHDAQEPLSHLKAIGDLPDGYGAIRDRYLAEQAREGTDVDLVFEIPLELAKSVNGFRHDQDAPFEEASPFRVLQPEGATGRPWWRPW